MEEKIFISVGKPIKKNYVFKCEHGKNKYNCQDCNSSSYCEHGIKKSFCIKCDGISLCKHNKKKWLCRDCDGSSFCIHRKYKSMCKECGGSSYCKHGKQKSCCKECDGSRICTHGIQIPICKNCKGSQICQHEKQKSRCKECDGKQLCKSEWCEKQGNKNYEGYCLFCYVHLYPDNQIVRNYKTKERDVVDRIQKIYSDFTWIHDKKIQDGCSLRRPDLLLDLGSHIIIIEVDENAHSDYDCSCENKRLMLLSQDVGHRSIVFIRFNPDSYIDKDGNKIKSCWKINKTTGLLTIDPKKINEWEARINILIEQIKYWVENPSDKMIEIIQLFYS